MNKQQLANKIWASANKMRSKIEASEYKDYILGLIFYKFLSDNEVSYLLKNGVTEEYQQQYLKEDYENDYSKTLIQLCQDGVGYFIEYRNLFSTWLKPGSDFSVSDLSVALDSFDRLVRPNFANVYKGIFNTLRAGLQKLGESPAAQTRALKDLIKLIRDIPEPEEPVVDEQVCGTVTTDCTMKWYDVYHQSNQIHIDKSEVLQLMGISESDFQEAKVSIVPLMNDGSEGSNGTNGVFGGWFDENGEPGRYAQGHVYIEVFNDLWNWNCGLYQDNCYDEEHTVRMQYQYPVSGVMKKVNVEVHFTISWNWW